VPGDSTSAPASPMHTIRSERSAGWGLGPRLGSRTVAGLLPTRNGLSPRAPLGAELRALLPAEPAVPSGSESTKTLWWNASVEGAARVLTRAEPCGAGAVRGCRGWYGSAHSLSAGLESSAPAESEFVVKKKTKKNQF